MLSNYENKINDLLENTGDMALKRRARNILENLNLESSDVILDVGCGDGYYLHLLSNLGIKLNLTGTDLDQKGLGKAEKNLDKEVNLVNGDLMSKLPFPRNHFDKVIMSEVAEHLPNDVKGLKEVCRVMKKGGLLCLTVPNHNYPFLWDPVNWLLEHLLNTHIRSGFFAGLWNQHIRLYRPQEIKEVVEKARFKVVAVESLTFWCLPFNHYIVNLVARGLASDSFSKSTTTSLSKYTKNPQRNFLLNCAFWVVNAIDKLNDYLQPKNRGVSIFVCAVKS